MLAIFAAAWLVLAAIVAILMRRRGHEFYVWALLAGVLGPLVIPLAVAARRARVAGAQLDHPGTLDVLVADDGSAGAAAAYEAARAVLRSPATSWTFVTVVDAEAATTTRGRDTEHEARDRLAERARSAAGELDAPVDIAVLHGDAASELCRYAVENGYEVIVAGSHSHRLSRAVLGSVARRLASASSVPVLVGPASRSR